MIFELADGGSLRKHLEKHFKDLTWKDKYKLGLEITNGLKHLHDLDIIHKDLVFIAHVISYELALIIIKNDYNDFAFTSLPVIC